MSYSDFIQLALAYSNPVNVIVKTVCLAVNLWLLNRYGILNRQV